MRAAARAHVSLQLASARATRRATTGVARRFRCVMCSSWTWETPAVRASARRLQGAVLSPRITASVRRSMCYQYGSSRTRHKGSSSALEPPPHHRFREPEVLADLHPAKLPLVVIGV